MTRGTFILLYHRISEPDSDPWQLCVSPSHFAEQLEVMRRHSRVVPLARMVDDLAGGEDVHGALALTFDDGYADNLAARSRLESFEAHATVFITTGYIGGQREFWWDELDRLLLQPGVLPPTLQVTIDGQAITVSLGAAARYSLEAALLHRRWRAYEDEPPGPRQAAYLLLWERLVVQPALEQRRILSELAVQAGSGTPRLSHRAMTSEEVVAVASSPLIEIGAHTVTHPALPAQTLAAQQEEIRTSKTDLETLVGGPMRSFSYPHGRYTPESIDLVRDAGFQYACAVRPQPGVTDLSRCRPDPYLLPRIVVQDWDGDMFERKLRAGFEN